MYDSVSAWTGRIGQCIQALSHPWNKRDPGSTEVLSGNWGIEYLRAYEQRQGLKNTGNIEAKAVWQTRDRFTLLHT